ncbi:Helix-turn-helix domain [Capnocytophaga ochracea]|uniref:Helix-turn-helix domain n=1 Tax=Capnocytophaga ochracea TaxID=1018 RepID=A0A7Z9CB01_CAPOC|nr:MULTISPECIES: helix-turn-helix domain-containing protein [Capnocytophaga]EIW94073.1 DNA-binding helix-turn-helix protein [Capnocytophaga sp. oral taxon 412 str. F0487]VDG81185.1 Helix-turn-helix domain [Capnocytophaga ochracea]
MNTIQITELTTNELKSLLKESVKQEFNQLKEEILCKTPTQYLTRKQVAKMLDINLTTLNNWTNRGALTSYGIQGRVYYKRDEVERAFIKLKQNSPI